MAKSNLVGALNSFEGFQGAALEVEPTNQAEFSALRNANDGGSIYSGTAPTWAEVEAKMAELDAEEAAEDAIEVSGRKKLQDLGLTESELEKLFPG